MGVDFGGGAARANAPQYFRNTHAFISYHIYTLPNLVCPSNISDKSTRQRTTPVQLRFLFKRPLIGVVCPVIRVPLRSLNTTRWQYAQPTLYCAAYSERLCLSVLRYVKVYRARLHVMHCLHKAFYSMMS